MMAQLKWNEIRSIIQIESFYSGEKVSNGSPRKVLVWEIFVMEKGDMQKFLQKFNEITKIYIICQKIIGHMPVIFQRMSFKGLYHVLQLTVDSNGHVLYWVIACVNAPLGLMVASILWIDPPPNKAPSSTRWHNNPEN
jgi:hypothetical protein